MTRVARNSNMSFAAFKTRCADRLIKKHDRDRDGFKVKNFGWVDRRYNEMVDLREALINAALNGREW